MATTFNTSLTSNIGSTGIVFSITETSQTGNIVTVDSSSGLAVDMEVIVLGTTIGNLIAGTYYIQSITSATEITFSTTQSRKYLSHHGRYYIRFANTYNT